MKPTTAPTPDPQLVLALALSAGCCTKTSAKALKAGAAGIKGYALRERLLAGAASLGISLPLAATSEVG